MCLSIDFADVGPGSLAKFAASTRNILTEYQKSIEYGVGPVRMGIQSGVALDVSPIRTSAVRWCGDRAQQ